VGGEGEARALVHLQAAGLALVARNFKSPGRGGGEIDLIMREPDGTLVFVEVRHRASTAHGGAAASVGWAKQRRIIFAARHFLARLAVMPPCRFDVVALQGHDMPGASGDTLSLQWIRGAFDASGHS
jgi:putative endonuclease